MTNPFVTRLRCSETDETLAPDRAHNVSAGGWPLLVDYDLDAVAAAVTKTDLAARPGGMWRYRELMPHGPGTEVSLGEAETPLVPLAAAARRLGLGEVMVKDEGRLPTGSFKARGLALAITMAKSFGLERLAMPTAGNAGAALAAYGARAGMETFVFTPADTPEVTAREIAFHGARTFRVDGLINDCGKIVADGTQPVGWFDFSTLREPYRIEGKKTMGLELADQLGWRDLPDAIFYPTGGGTGLIAMWKAFNELRQMGWLAGPLPKMVSVQTTGCCPVVRAWEAGADEIAEPFAPVTTEVHGVRVPKPLGHRLIMRTIKESDGFAVAAEDDRIEAVRAETAATEGVHLCPEGAACLVAIDQARESGLLAEGARVALFNCASGLKSPLPPLTGPVLEPDGVIDWAWIAGKD